MTVNTMAANSSHRCSAPNIPAVSVQTAGISLLCVAHPAGRSTE
eukprot:SAG25_NODE_14343_length_256_cov_0.656051_1_plen_43_part_10